jgi:hypothetical protein
MLVADAERLSQLPHGRRVGRAVHSTLQVGNGAPTEPGPLGQFLLRQTGRCAVPSQQQPERSARLRRGHASSRQGIRSVFRVRALCAASHARGPARLVSAEAQHAAAQQGHQQPPPPARGSAHVAGGHQGKLADFTSVPRDPRDAERLANHWRPRLATERPTNQPRSLHAAASR